MPESVLVVEDEPLIAMDLQTILEAQGWRVMGPVASVREALAALAVELPSVALLDVNLGTELITPVAQHLKMLGIPFALASAYEKPEQYGGTVLAGAPNAGKPTNSARVIAAIEQIVRGR